MKIVENQNYIVRAKDAGVFFGKITEHKPGEITMTDVRKLWYWSGACAVEQIALDGVKNPGNCQFTVTVPEMTIADPIQIIACTKKAAKIIAEVPEWKR